MKTLYFDARFSKINSRSVVLFGVFLGVVGSSLTWARDSLTYTPVFPASCKMSGLSTASSGIVPICGTDSPLVVRSEKIVENDSWAAWFLNAPKMRVYSEEEQTRMWTKEVLRIISASKGEQNTWPTSGTQRNKRISERYLGCHFELRKKEVRGDTVLELSVCNTYRDTSWKSFDSEGLRPFRPNRYLSSARKLASRIDTRRKQAYENIDKPWKVQKQETSVSTAQKKKYVDPFAVKLFPELPQQAPADSVARETRKFPATTENIEKAIPAAQKTVVRESIVNGIPTLTSDPVQ